MYNSKNPNNMKRIFTSLAMVLFAVAMFAWQKPAITAGQWQQMVPGDTVYFYNTQSQLFLTEGNEWGTHASVGEEGLLFTVEKYIAEGAEWDNKTYLIKDYSLAKASWKTMFIDNDMGDIYVDLGSQANYYWEFETVNDKMFRFFGADMNPQWNHAYEFFTGGYVGHVTEYMNTSTNETTGMGVIFDVPTNYGEGAAKNGEFHCDWTTVSRADYDVYVAKIRAYNAAVALAAKIEEGKAAGVSTAEAEAVYNNENSTAEELRAALDALVTAILEAEAGKASPENPVDMSAKIVNHDFANGDCTTGWNGDAFGRGGTVADGAEHYSKNFDTYQDITGLYPGIYRVGVQGFYRAGAAGSDYNSYLDNDLGTRNTKFYALNGDSVETVVGIVHLASGAEAQNLSGANEVDCGDGLFVCNTMQAADYHFNTLDKYHNYLFCEVTESGTLRIGVRKTELISTDWSLFDNFSLEYYGSSIEAYKMWMEGIIAEAPEYDFETLICSNEVKEMYQAVLEAALNATTRDEIMDALAKITPASETIAANVAAYKAYLDKVAELRAELEENEYICEEGYTLIDYLMDGNEMEPCDEMPNGSYDYIIAKCALDTEGIQAELAWLEALHQAAIANSLQPGQDCTNLLVNPGFTESDGKGWTWDLQDNVSVATHAVTGGLKSFPCAEVYAGWGSAVGDFTWDVWQTVIAPDGIYKLELNAFYRVGDNGQYDGSEEVFAELYMNDFATPVQNIGGDSNNFTDEAVGEGDASITNWQGVTGYVPNSMNGASTAFESDRYKQTVYGVVEGGQMRIGIRKTIATSVMRSWCLWTNFKLYYVGKDKDALTEILPVYAEKAQVILDADQPMSAEARKGLEDAIDAANTADDADTMFDALTGLNAAIAKAHSSVNAYAKLNDALYALLSAADLYGNSASEEASNAAVAIYDELSDGMNRGAYNDAEIDEKVAAINAAIAALRVPAVDPTDEEPIDFTDWIVNPAYDEENADGWTIAIETRTNAGYQGASYSGTASISQFIEVWRSGNEPLGDGEVFQTISYLPEGTYVLGADVISSYQGDASVEVTGVQLFCEEEDGTVNAVDLYTGNGTPDRFEVIFKKKAGTDVKIGLRVTETNANWIAADNWTLSFHGKNSSLLPSKLDVIETEPAQVVIYNLAGQRLTTLQKGINIVNGKKILVK